MTADHRFRQANKQDLFPTIRPPNPLLLLFIYRNLYVDDYGNLLGRHPEWSRRIRYFKKCIVAIYHPYAGSDVRCWGSTGTMIRC